MSNNINPRPDPDRHLQEFGLLREYLRQGRAPWRAHRSGVNEELHREDRRAPSARVFPLRTTWRAAGGDFGDALRERFTDDLKHGATSSLLEADPRSSAFRVMTPGQSAIFAMIALAGATAFAVHPLATLIAVNCLATAYFIGIIFFRLYLAAVALNLPAERPGPAPVADHALPMVTILLPLFREANAFPALIESMSALDYPAAKLDIKILLEEGDDDTVREVRRRALDERFEIIIVPTTFPQTKPKACNYGLYCARGDLVVIYDAEDQPDADQLRKAAAAFATGGDDLACVQARLNYYNADENWLTRLFTLEYSLWFDSLLPALEHLKAPIPLGGTSNCFRTDTLVALGGWDPYNVTEDADLGLRLARRGYRTEIIDSTTFEEANCDVGNWIRQRSRWMKGYIQTWLVHMRAPFAHRRRAGWRGVAATHLFVAGNVFSALINPFLWGLFAYWLVTRSSDVAGLFPGPLLHLNLFAFLFGNFLFVYLAMLAPLKRGWPQLSGAALLMPVYWWLSSVAAYKALWQLMTRPSFWEKTDHGLSRDARARRINALRNEGRI